jgi:dihydroneopterin aldolase
MVTTSRLFLTGIRASGHHGANRGERDLPQEFVVDLDVEVRVSADELSGTSDYRTLIQVAREVVVGRSFALLESLAEAVAAVVAHQTGVVRATAIVHKPSASASNDVQGIAAAATVEP